MRKLINKMLIVDEIIHGILQQHYLFEGYQYTDETRGADETDVPRTAAGIFGIRI